MSLNFCLKIGNGKLEIQHKAFNGFTLIETLMALFVLMTGVVTGFAVISQAVHTSPTTRQQLIAANLAQEAIEIARGVRDNTLLQIADLRKQNGILPTTPTWHENLNMGGGPGTFHTRTRLASNTDISSGWVVTCCSAAQEWQEVFINDTTGFYANLCVTGGCSTAGWRDSGFRRALRIEKYPTGCTTNCTEVYVKARVYWNADADPATCPTDNCIILEDRFTNWVDYLESFL